MILYLSPLPLIQFPDVPGGLLFTAQPGTGAGPSQAFPKPTYKDSYGSVLNLNPVVLDNEGRASVFLDGYYDMALYDGVGIWPGSLIFTQTNVSAAGSTGEPQWIETTGPITYVDANDFSVPGDQIQAFQPGTAVKAAVAGGVVFGFVQSVYTSGSPVATHVNVSWLGLPLDPTVSEISSGVITGGTEGSLPLQPIQPVTGDYTITPVQMFTQFVANSVTPLTITLPNAAAVPSGSWIKITNIGAGLVSLLGTINGSTTQALVQYLQEEIFSDGTSWWGDLESTGSYLTAIVQDVNPALGGNLDMSGHNIQTVTPTEMAYLHGVTGLIQTQFSGKIGVTYNLPTVDGTYEGRSAVRTAGENLVFGDQCYIKSDGKCWKCDATSMAKMPCSYFALATITAGNTGAFLFSMGEGALCKTSWSWTVGGIVYIDLGGGLTQAGGDPDTYFTTTGNVVQAVGVAASATCIIVPAPVLVTVKAP